MQDRIEVKNENGRMTLIQASMAAVFYSGAANQACYDTM
jgi:hypothetical protein